LHARRLGTNPFVHTVQKAVGQPVGRALNVDAFLRVQGAARERYTDSNIFAIGMMDAGMRGIDRSFET
jgi:hypothetical protein